MKPRFSGALAALAWGALAACEQAPAPAERAPASRPSASTVASAPAPPSSAPAPKAEVSGLAGTWEGRFEAKKGSVSLPPKVKDKGLAADDGKAAVGPGTLELTISADGALRGKGKGALGACTLVGRAEEGTVRATWNPDDPRAEGAMTGVFVGALEGDVLRGEVRVAGPDATIVREAAVELKRR